MFLWQKYNKTVRFISDDREFIDIQNKFNNDKPKVVAFDTESDGLNISSSKPFLIGFGWGNLIYAFEPTKWRNEQLFKMVSSNFVEFFVSHNAKFDYHMFRNYGTPIPENIKIGDTFALARLTEYSDSLNSLSLSALAKLHIDDAAEFGEKAIREHINQLNGERLRKIGAYVKENRKSIGMNYTDFMRLYKSKVKHIDYDLNEHFDFVDVNYPEITYEDSYKNKPALMINYLFDDIFMTLEVFNTLIKILELVDPDFKTFNRENKLIRVVGDLESNGMRVDIDYLLKSRENVLEYSNKTYDLLWKLCDIENLVMNEDSDSILLRNNKKFSVGQHKVIKALFAKKFRIGMLSTDMVALKEIANNDNYPKEAKEIAKLIVELRSLDKVLSTYIEGKLNSLIGDRLYTNINNSGTVTGRVSSDLQQQPKHATFTRDGDELFHPRKPFINDEGFTNYFLDFSNMELRVQAYYTMVHSDGDVNMCRAFIPFKYKNIYTGEMYDPAKDIHEFNNGSWVNDDGDFWKPLDLHSVTTLNAFENVSETDANFKDFRDLGKRANFLLNYGGGVKTLTQSLNVTPEVAKSLSDGYYSAFPKINDYRKWAENHVNYYGYAPNLYGRRYYIRDKNYTYKVFNYLIQGSCADYIKEKQIELYEFLKDKESAMLLPIHDELVFRIKNGEEHIVKEIKRIMEDSSNIIPLIPMLVGVEKTDTNWAEASEVIL